jgi:plastocyanin
MGSRGLHPRLGLAVAVLVAATVAAGSHRAAAQERAAIHGGIQLLVPDGSSVPAQDAVVWIAAATGTAGAGATASSASAAQLPAMQSKGKRFEPHVLAVSTGASVNFPNVDTIFHNAFTVSPGNQFDLGLYRKGASKAVTFVRPGVVRVYCNIHQDMAGYVLVLDRAASAVTARDGSFRMTGVPAGRQQIHVWHEMGGEIEAAVDVQAGGDVAWSVQLDARQFRREGHKNKYGKDYPPVRRDADRY